MTERRVGPREEEHRASPVVVPQRTGTHREHDETRTRLLDITVRLAAEQGLGRTSVRTICEEAGVVRRTFYRYFGDAPSAFLAASRGLHADLRATIDRAYAHAATPPLRALDCVDALIGFVRADPARARVLFVEGPAGGIAVDAVRAETVEWAIGLVTGSPTRHAAAPAHPWDRPTDVSTPRLLAEIAVGGVISVVWRQLIRDEIDRIGDAAPYMVEALLRPHEWAIRRR